MNTPVFCYLLQYPYPIDSTQRPLSHVEKHALPRNYPVNINRRKREARVRAPLLQNVCLLVSKESMSLCESFHYSDSRIKICVKTICTKFVFLVILEKSKLNTPLRFITFSPLLALKYYYINSSKSTARKNVRWFPWRKNNVNLYAYASTQDIDIYKVSQNWTDKI